MRVVVVGQGYVGLPLAIRAAEVGHQVVGYDVDARRVKSLAAGESYVEDVSSARLAKALELGTYQASDQARDCGGFDVAVVTVPTPLQDGAPDLRYIEESAHTLARFLRPGATVVLESTTYPGTTEELFGPILEDGSGLTAGVDFHLGYSPERIDPGNKVWGFQQTPKVVSGVNALSLKAVETFYAGLVDTTVPVRSPKEAELAKLLENTFRHVNIALVNEIAMFARHLDIDVWQTIEAASSKPFGFMKFTPGPGVGGHCLPIDPSYLSWRVQRELGQNFRFVELANDINSHMPEYVTRRIMDALNAKRRSVNGSRILLLGLAYKKNTGDARESPAVRVSQLLLDMGAKVRAADPHVVESIKVDARLSRVEPTRKELAAADVVVLLTDHDSFDYPMITEHASLILDCRNRLSGPTVEVL
ncbi:nucleotide sugar dehydrogenase [Streptomyces sp. NPDC002812]|uniref:nucleotide sugar dehydrogenase n=1 Tax=unclassified Streptomyces TaxID=2593676 RepID=UPI00202F773E|nr:MULTISPECIES: nucleotide sugar dehydrogenase [unclassified Streptomyces]MCM1972151.1 nucleotide sugar dehydrogenase [Streptomyces sp. G1]MCX5129576.1 nucleotide sugar dehydrogenase [Streptomyces sp. NBC_00347]MCX5300654.1 nucleotide sugar dehydrogenase [Streptomyces sp. NBC_00193]